MNIDLYLQSAKPVRHAELLQVHLEAVYSSLIFFLAPHFV
jgi:hypothetical protein